MNIKAIFSVFCLCGVMHANGQDILHRAYNRLKSIDFYSRIGFSNREGTYQQLDKAALAYGLAWGVTVNLGKQWDVQVTGGWERGALLAEGNVATFDHPDPNGIRPGIHHIVRRETHINYKTFSVMPKFYFGRKGKAFVGLGGFASRLSIGATDYTTSKGDTWSFRDASYYRQSPSVRNWDLGVMLYGGISFWCLQRPIEAAANFRYGFVDFRYATEDNFRISSLCLTLSMPVYVFHQEGSRKSRQSLK